MSEAAPGTPTRRRLFSGPRILVLGLSLLAVAVIAFYMTVFLGAVVGEEFSPDTFKRREFQYYEIPVINLQVSPISRNDITGDLEKHLVDKSLISAKTKPEAARWDFVRAHRGFSSSPATLISRGDALILCRYLDATDAEQKSIWLEWSKKNRPAAKVLWPVVAKLARQRLYVLIPEVLALVQEDTNTDKLRARIDDLLVEKYLALAACQQELGRHAEAVELYGEVLRLKPDSEAARKGRARSSESLGKRDEGSADRAQAEKG